MAQLIEKIADFAFYNELQASVARLYGEGSTVESLIDDGRYKELVAAIIQPDGLNYGQLPKALLTFHRYADSVRTAPSKSSLPKARSDCGLRKGGKVRLHFTVSANHRKLFEAKLAEAIPAMQKKFGVEYEVSL